MNQDQFVIATMVKELQVRSSSLPDRQIVVPENLTSDLLAVADGAGGMDLGEEASGYAAEVLLGYVQHTMPWFYHHFPGAKSETDEDWVRAVEACNEALVAHAARLNARMATTLTLAYVRGRSLLVTQVGDSRCYLIRSRTIRRLTRDQTVAQDLIDQGRLTEEEAEHSRFSHILTSALGGETAKLTVERYHYSLQPGDTLVLCTDGLAKALDDEQLLAKVNESVGLEECCQSLVEAGNSVRNSDDTTVIMAEFDEYSPRGKGKSRDADSPATLDEDSPTLQLPQIEADDQWTEG